MLASANKIDAVLFQRILLKHYRHFGWRSYFMKIQAFFRVAMKLLYAMQWNQLQSHHLPVTSHCLMDALLATCCQYVYRYNCL